MGQDLADEIVDILRMRHAGTRECLESLVLALCATVVASGGISGKTAASARLARDILGVINDHIDEARVSPMTGDERSRKARPLGHMTDPELARMRGQIEREMRARDLCEHGVNTGEFCPGCREEYRRAREEHGDG